MSSVQYSTAPFRQSLHCTAVECQRPWSAKRITACVCKLAGIPSGLQRGLLTSWSEWYAIVWLYVHLRLYKILYCIYVDIFLTCMFGVMQQPLKSTESITHLLLLQWPCFVKGVVVMWMALVIVWSRKYSICCSLFTVKVWQRFRRVLFIELLQYSTVPHGNLLLYSSSKSIHAWKMKIT